MSGGHRRLPILQPGLDRRELLILGLAGGLGACASEAVPVSRADGASPADDAARRVDDDAAHGARDGASPDAQERDASPAQDAGTDDAAVARDTGADAADARVDPPDADVDAGAVDAGPPQPPPPGFVVLGPMSDFPLNRWVSAGAANQAFIVGRDAAGVFIYSAVCTHTGCLVPPPAGPGRNSVCPCHISVFDSNGARLSGPARGPLTHRDAFISGGTLYVHPTRVVPATTRTPAP